ncbi:MAG TPA: hypothetical protein VK663_14310, partial [Burkholderiales bacterium]|nr:hypothetical protein [Burkholderiales bacterium]
ERRAGRAAGSRDERFRATFEQAAEVISFRGPQLVRFEELSTAGGHATDGLLPMVEGRRLPRLPYRR